MSQNMRQYAFSIFCQEGFKPACLVTKNIDYSSLSNIPIKNMILHWRYWSRCFTGQNCRSRSPGFKHTLLKDSRSRVPCLKPADHDPCCFTCSMSGHMLNPFSTIVLPHSYWYNMHETTKGVLAIRRIFSLVDMIAKPKFWNCPNVF